MHKNLILLFKSLPFTLIGGACLLLSLIIPKIPLYLDPAWAALIICGVPLVQNAVRKLMYNKGISKISSALLISTAMVAAVAIGDLFAAGEVAFIMAIGELLEDKTTARAKKGLKQLVNLSPTVGRRIEENGEATMIAAQNIQIGDVLRILPGEAIPVDGEIISGETSVDQSVITGESLPVDKAVGDSVFCGTVNRFGSIDIRACKVGEDSSLQKLIRMVKEAENKKAPIQRIADRWASLLVPAALVIAVIAGLIKQDITVAVTVLVVFCPCALVLATPTAIMAAIGQATKQGVIIKSGEALEKMGRVTTVAFDKTGTLTHGKLTVSDIISFTPKLDQKQLLALIASVESKSEHPLGKATVEQARQAGAKLLQTEGFVMWAGKGVSAKVGAIKLYCGNERLIKEVGVKFNNKVLDTLDIIKSQGKAHIIAATEKEILGLIALCDSIKTESPAMLKQLNAGGINTVLLTGDSKKAASYFGKKLGINNLYAELLPEDKVRKIQELKRGNAAVCMIGDGVNDAPALKSADVSVAMGSAGSDIAVDAADIAIMGDDVSKIPYLMRLAKATVKTVRISIILSLAINLLAIVLSFFSLLNPTTGALVHNAGSVLVILFAALLYDRRF